MVAFPISDLAALGPKTWAICVCGHRAVVPLTRIAARYPGASVATVRRALRCTGCRHRSRPMLGVTLAAERPRPVPAIAIAKPQNGLDFIGLAFDIAAARALDQFAKDDQEGHAKMQAENDAAGRTGRPRVRREKWLD